MAGYSGKPLAAKLGLKGGQRALFVRAPPGFRGLLGPVPGLVVRARPAQDLDVVHIFAQRRIELERDLPRHLKWLAPRGMLWVSWPKKASKVPTDITEGVVREVALPLGLVDVKVCAIDEVWSGLKLVRRRT